MRVRAVREAELEILVDELWAPLAAEMTECSAFDELVAEARERTLAYKRDRLEDEAVRTLVAAEEDRLLGFVTAEIVDSPPIFTRGSELHIEELFVPEEHRRRGVATELLEAVRTLAAEQDCETVSVDVNAGNTVAKRFYVANELSLDRETYRTRVPKSH